MHTRDLSLDLSTCVAFMQVREDKGGIARVLIYPKSFPLTPTQISVHVYAIRIVQMYVFKLHKN